MLRGKNGHFATPIHHLRQYLLCYRDTSEHRHCHDESKKVVITSYDVSREEDCLGCPLFAILPGLRVLVYQRVQRLALRFLIA